MDRNRYSGHSGAARIVIAPGQIPADAPAAADVAGIVGAVEHRAFHRVQVGFDEIQLTGVGGLRHDGDPLGPVNAQDRMLMRVEVVHDHKQTPAARVAGAQPAEGGQDIAGAAFRHRQVPISQSPCTS